MNKEILELNGDYNQSFVESAINTSVNTFDRGYIYTPIAINSSPLLKWYNIILKRTLDITFSIIAIVFLLSWLLPIIAVFIKFDSTGPIFFIQKRNSKDGRVFYCLKLRTMIVNAEADTLTAVPNDERITRLGKFLRNSHLDELPQFINVLIGDMSLIGPRPHMFVENIKYKALLNSYHERHVVKPGITGLAQSLGYNGPLADIYQLEKKIEFDIFYINNWSLLLDVKILVRTSVKICKNLFTN